MTDGCLAVNVVGNQYITCELTTGLSNESEMESDHNSEILVLGKPFKRNFDSYSNFFCLVLWIRLLKSMHSSRICTVMSGGSLSWGSLPGSSLSMGVSVQRWVSVQGYLCHRDLHPSPCGQNNKVKTLSVIKFCMSLQITTNALKIQGCVWMAPPVNEPGPPPDVTVHLVSKKKDVRSVEKGSKVMNVISVLRGSREIIASNEVPIPGWQLPGMYREPLRR